MTFHNMITVHTSTPTKVLVKAEQFPHPGRSAYPPALIVTVKLNRHECGERNNEIHHGYLHWLLEQGQAKAANHNRRLAKIRNGGDTLHYDGHAARLLRCKRTDFGRRCVDSITANVTR